MNEIVEFIAKHEVIVICRSLYDNKLIKTIRTLCGGGIRVVETTFDRADPDVVEKTCDTIRTIKKRFPQMEVGSGTVTCAEHVLATKKAGGGFCLSPDVDTEVIRATKEAGLISIPGAMTSTEILQVHNAGAGIVKTFPTRWLGLSYLKNIKGPISHVKFPAATGMNGENFKECLSVGYCAAGISGRFINQEVIAEGNFEELARRARIFTDVANAC